MEYITHSPEETEALGAEYAKSLKAGDVVAFSGDLGAGKTAFTRGVLHGLGYEGRVTSPTFAIANEYETPTVKVAHFDLYRILDSEALFEIGFDEYLDGSRIVLIEWSENAADVLPEAAHRRTDSCIRASCPHPCPSPHLRRTAIRRCRSPSPAEKRPAVPFRRTAFRSLPGQMTSRSSRIAAVPRRRRSAAVPYRTGIGSLLLCLTFLHHHFLFLK